MTKAARNLQITANALIHGVVTQDRDGICHQLANEDRLRWTKL
ncbi:MAG: ABC-three component system protein [Reyranellaceae bacterium]